MTVLAFGQSISVLGPNNGFQGTVSRFGERVIAARQFVPTTPANNLNFGDPAVIVPNTSGGYFDSLADFVATAANIALLVTQWAGIAVREVKTSLTYPAGQTPGIQQVGYYQNGQMAEVLERGSATVLLSVGAPSANAQLYNRIVLNGAIPAGLVGDWETNPAATDLFSTTGTGTAGSATLTIASGTNTQNNQLVSGAGIAPGTYVASGGGTTTITLSQNIQATLAASTLVTFSNLFACPGVVARTGNLDSNNILEVTIERRYAA